MSRSAALDYLREQHALMADAYLDDCVTHASRLAILLAQDGLAPWIGSIREVSETPRGPMHHPLIPLRYAGRRGPTWNVHYVCRAGDEAWDPLIGEPVPAGELAMRVFGREIPLRESLSPERVAEWIAGGAERLARELIVSPAAPRSA
jgi:hypothetical protein